MTPASYLPADTRFRPSRQRRLVSAALSVGIVVLLLLALLRLGVLPVVPPPAKRPISFTLTPDREEAAAQRSRAAARARAAAAASAPPATPAPVAPVPMVRLPAVRPVPVIQLSRDEFAATDIGKLGHDGAGDAGEGDDTGVDTAAVAGPGEGPGGARLYKAEWYREPAAGALALYLPGGPQPGWATIACRTIPAYHVENCREIDESPRGSGLARALRQAAWQFLVRPPRLGGKPLMGVWVSIRFDFTEKAAKP